MAARSHSMSSTDTLADALGRENDILTLIEIGLVEVIWSRDIHIVQASDLPPISLLSTWYHAESYTLRCPLKCCNSFISRSARFARIFLLNTFVTFLIATPSCVWELVAALYHELATCALQLACRPGFLPDNTISSLSQLFGDSVSLVNDEVLVEDFKHLPPLKIRHDAGIKKECLRSMLSSRKMYAQIQWY